MSNGINKLRNFDVDADVKNVYRFLHLYLPAYMEWLSKKNINFKQANEWILNDEMEAFFVRRLKDNDIPYNLKGEPIEENSKNKADFGFSHQDENIELETGKRYFFKMEAKRLPTPPERRQATEYVYYQNSTKSGGIERFKQNKHAKELSISAMIGYIQDNNDFIHWHTTINEWIEQATKNDTLGLWNNGDCLVFYENNNTFAVLHSEHNRLSPSTPILLYHFWLLG